MDNFFKRASQQEVDIVAVTGDIIDTNKGIEPAVEYFSMLKHRYGIFCCTGNHDDYCFKPHHGMLYSLGLLTLEKVKRNNCKALQEGLEKIGGKFLRNEFFSLQTEKGDIEIYGIHPPIEVFFEKNIIRSQAPFVLEMKEQLKKQKKRKHYTIFLTHTPDFATVINRGYIDLFLAGHTHGGIIRHPKSGPLLYMSRIQRIISQGIYAFQDYTIHVNPGLSDNKPIPRIGTKSEASILKLECKQTEEKP